MQTQPDNLRSAERAPETRPAYLYHFVHGTTHYYLTNYDRDIETSGSLAQTWESSQVAHEMGEGSAELSQRQATVALGILDAEFRRYFLTAPPQRATVEIYRLNSGALPGPLDFEANAFMEFSGVALGPAFNDAAIAITFASELAQEDKAILRFNYQPQCNHIIYGGGCFVNRELHKVEVASVAVANRANRYIDVAVTTVPNGVGSAVAVTAQSFEGGYLKETATGNLVGIVSSALLGGGLVRLFLQWFPTTLAAAVAVTLYKGCRHTVAGCVDDFNNLDGQFGIITDLRQDGPNIFGTMPPPWRAFANRYALCAPLYNGVAVPHNADDNTVTWRYNELVDTAGGPVNLGPDTIAFLNRTLVDGDTAKLPRLGGFGGHPFIGVANPAIDGVQS